MPVFKRRYESGKTVWRYIFSAPGSNRQDRRLIEAVGFASKQDAIDAEAKRRTEELQKYELVKAGGGPVARGAADYTHDAVRRVFPPTR